MKKVTFYSIVVWVIGILFYLFEFFLGVFTGTIATDIMTTFSINAEQFSLIGIGYYIIYGIMQIPVGLIVKRFGARMVLTFACSICTLGTFWFSFTSSFFPAILSRMMMGFGASFAFVSMLVLLLNWFPQKHFGFLSGLSQMLGTVGGILAGGPMAFLLNAFDGDWQLILRGLGFVGIIITILIYTVVRNKPPRTSGALIPLTYSQSIKKDFLNLMKRKKVWCVVFYAGLVYCSAPLLGAFWGTTFLVSKGYSKEIAATIISLVWVGMAFGSPFWGWLSGRIKKRKMVLVTAAAVGLLSSSVLFFPIKWEWLLCVMIFGLGLGAAGQALSFASATEIVPRSIHAACIGMNNCMIIAFVSFVPPFSSSIIQSGSVIVNGVTTYPEASFFKGLMIVPIAFFLALIVSLFKIKETFCRQQHEVHGITL